jgi:hypothetical protein
MIFSGLGGFSIGDVSDPNVNGPLSKGILTFDRTWQFKLLGTYYLPLDAYLTTDFRWFAGKGVDSRHLRCLCPGLQ